MVMYGAGVDRVVSRARISWLPTFAMVLREPPQNLNFNGNQLTGSLPEAYTSLEKLYVSLGTEGQAVPNGQQRWSQ